MTRSARNRYSPWPLVGSGSVVGLLAIGEHPPLSRLWVRLAEALAAVGPGYALDLAAVGAGSAVAGQR